MPLRHHRRRSVFPAVSAFVAASGGLAVVAPVGPLAPPGVGVARAQPHVPGHSLVAPRCAAWIDKALAEVVAFHPQHGPVFHTRLYIKLDARQIPLSGLARVGWAGRTRTVRAGVSVAESPTAPKDLAPFAGARDYFVADFGNLEPQDWDFVTPDPYALEHEGAFFVETTEGVTYWINEGGRAFGDFRVDVAFERRLLAAGLSVGSVGLARLPSVDAAPRTADAFQELNPAGCR